MQGLAYVLELPKFFDNDYQSRKVSLPPSQHKKLAIFDMDETLIHCLGSKKYDDNRRRMNDRGVELCAENSEVVLKGKGYENFEDRH